ncbi:MAG: AbiV family abortive infection protein [Alphaproteobacteria bacterium]
MSQQKSKRELALRAIYRNIQHLRAEANIAFSSRRHSSAVHFAILANEEAAKYLLVYCKEHVADSVYKSRFRHIPKHRISLAPWHMAGMISAANLMYTLDSADIEDAGNAFGKITKSLLSGYREPEKVAEIILECLKPDDNAKREERRATEMLARDMDRRSSVYVDLSDDFEIIGSPSKMGKKKAVEYIESMNVAVATIDFVRSPKFGIDQYMDALPASLRRENRKMAATFLKRLRKSLAENKKGG